MDPFAPEGVLPNVLRWIGRPGQAVRNVLRGDSAAAGRQLLDFAGEGIDWALPGDLIPAATRREDYVSGSELVGLAPDANPWARTATDIGVELATDPISFLSFGLTGAAKTAAAAGKAISKPTYGVSVGVPFLGRTEKAIPGLDAFDAPVDPLSLAMRGTDKAIGGTLEALDNTRASKTVAGAQPGPLTSGYEASKAWVRRAAGAENLVRPDGTQPTLDMLRTAKAEGDTAARLYAEQATAALKGVPQDERVLVAKAIFGIDRGSLDPRKAGQAVGLSGNVAQDIIALSQKYGKDPVKMQALADKVLGIGKRQYEEGVAKGVFTPGGGAKDYLQRSWLGADEGADVASGASPSALKAQTLKTPQDIADYLNTGKVGLELDPAKLLVDRAQQQGTMLERANLARQLGGRGTLVGDVSQTKAAKGAREFGDDPLAGNESLVNSAKTVLEIEHKAGRLNADEFRRLTDALSGMPARKSLFKSLAGANRAVKGAMVYGVVLPKVGSLVRNKIGMGLQALATPGAREEAMTHLNPVTIVNELSRAFDEAYSTVFHGNKSWARSDELGKDITLIDDAFKNAQQTDDVAKYLIAQNRPDLAQAVKHGVMDGFVSTEELVKKIAADPNKQRWLDVYNAPGVMFQSLEQRGRLQTFKNLYAKNPQDAARAARLTKEAMFDYGISSEANRNLRDVVPFAQFAAKAIPQQAKWLSTKPAAAAAAGPLFYDSSGEQDYIYPYMQGQSRVSLGPDEAGNNLYLTNFGLPMESINMIPNLSGNIAESGRSISHGLLSSTQPLVKTAAAITTGKDPYFGTPFGSYSKLPIVGDAGDVGRYVNMVSGTGALDPLGYGALRQIGNATDEKKPGVARALDLATGAKLVAVDPDVSERQTISNYLDTRPDISQYKTYYQTGEQDPEFTELMSALREAKARSKAKKELAAAAQ